jgi:hypothetical protein
VGPDSRASGEPWVGQNKSLLIGWCYFHSRYGSGPQSLRFLRGTPHVSSCRTKRAGLPPRPSMRALPSGALPLRISIIFSASEVRFSANQQPGPHHPGRYRRPTGLGIEFLEPRRQRCQRLVDDRTRRAAAYGAVCGITLFGSARRSSPVGTSLTVDRRTACSQVICAGLRISRRRRDRWFADSPLERSGFELLVPRRNAVIPKRVAWIPVIWTARRHQFRRGTDGSNPVCSSGESHANSTQRARPGEIRTPDHPTAVVGGSCRIAARSAPTKSPLNLHQRCLTFEGTRPPAGRRR